MDMIKRLTKKALFRLACAAALLSLLGFFTRGSIGGGDNAHALPTLSFFHAAGSEIVSDSTGEKMAFRGVNLNGLEFGSFLNNPYPGVEGTNYFKPRSQDLDSVAVSGFNVIRVPFEWARLVSGWQSTDPLPTSLNSAYIGMLDNVVQLAAQRQIYVILDLHDFLKYWSGQSAQVCVNDSSIQQQFLARTWRLLADHYSTNTTVLGYDILNEPVRQEIIEPCGSCNWHSIAQLIVNEIRQVDGNHLIIVEGPNYSLASNWPVENSAPFIIDSVTPPRIVYSPHVYFDHNNDSRYDQPGEETGPIGQWQNYVPDRLLPVITWSIENRVPIYFGEMNVPCTAAWANVLEYAFNNFFEPFHLSVTAWHYIDPSKCSLGLCPLNLAACPSSYQLNVLKRYPGGVYQDQGNFVPTRTNSRIYDDQRVNPWDSGVGSWGSLVTNFCAPTPVLQGSCSIYVQFNQNNYDGVKFTHQYGLDARQFIALRLWIYLTGTGQQDFKVFTTSPRSDCNPGTDPEYPSFDQRPRLREYLSSSPIGQWQRVDIPLQRIVNPANFIINGIALQNLGTSQDAFYLDEISLVSADKSSYLPLILKVK